MDKKSRRLISIAFFLSGMAALIYEVVWTRALTIVLGSTVYAVSIMLATFMSGLALGGYLGGRLADRNSNPMRTFGLIECAIGVFGIITVPLMNALPGVYFHLYQSLNTVPAAFYAAQYTLCAAVMLAPTTLMGITFPLVTKSLTSGIEELGRKVGGAYSINTLGAIAGSLGAGFVLMPALGIKWSSFAGGAVNLCAGTLLIAFADKGGLKKAIPLVSVAVMLVGAAINATSDWRPLPAFYVAGKRGSYEALKNDFSSATLLMSGDYAEGYVAVYKGEIDNLLSLQTGAKIEGTAVQDIPNTTLLAALPASAFPEKPGEMLVIGLGAGATAWAAGRVSEHTTVVEINPGVIEAVSRFGLKSAGAGPSVIKADARQRLLYDERLYDVITSEPSVPVEAAAANLFTIEFYEIANRRLAPGGVYCQWIPGWLFKKQDARSCIKTFASVFPYVYLYRVAISNDYLMVGSREPFLYAAEELAKKAVNMAAPLALEILGGTAGSRKIDDFLTLTLIRDAQSIKEILAMQDVPVLTDDGPGIEFIAANSMLSR